jgi:hypothetical protein
MALPPDLSDAELARLLSSRSLAENSGTEALTAFVAGVRASYLQAPDQSTELQHIATMVETSRLPAERRNANADRVSGGRRRTSGIRGWRHQPFGKRLAGPALKLLTASLAAVLAASGLAVAGVKLPGPARGVGDSLGLPNQQVHRSSGVNPATGPEEAGPSPRSKRVPTHEKRAHQRPKHKKHKKPKHERHKHKKAKHKKEKHEKHEHEPPELKAPKSAKTPKSVRAPRPAK